MPKVWKDTIEEHRQAVREATIDTAAALVAEHGLRSVTMSQIAEGTGIGRATLYKYFSDVESILQEWHERQINEHLLELAAIRDGAEASDRLGAVLRGYGLIIHQSRKHHDTELAALMHRHGHVKHAEHQLRHLIQELVAEAQGHGLVRNDLAPEELVTYCLHALTAASRVSSKAAVLRVVEVTLDGLRHP